MDPSLSVLSVLSETTLQTSGPPVIPESCIESVFNFNRITVADHCPVLDWIGLDWIVLGGMGLERPRCFWRFANFSVTFCKWFIVYCVLLLSSSIAEYMNVPMPFSLIQPELNYTGIKIFHPLPNFTEATLHLQLLDLSFLLNMMFCWNMSSLRGGQGVLRSQRQHLAGQVEVSAES